MIISCDGGLWELRSAPIRERDAFVIFDEAHCRGVDMKMRDGRAVLTLGPDMCKDVMMQAAGRMRKLDRPEGHRLLLVATPQVDNAIRRRPASASARQSGTGQASSLCAAGCCCAAACRLLCQTLLGSSGGRPP